MLCYPICVVLLLLLLAIMVPVLINIDKYSDKRLKIYFDFLQPIIVLLLILYSIVYLVQNQKNKNTCNTTIKQVIRYSATVKNKI